MRYYIVERKINGNLFDPFVMDLLLRYAKELHWK